MGVERSGETEACGLKLEALALTGRVPAVCGSPRFLQEDWAFLPQKASACRNLENPTTLGASRMLYLEIHIADRLLFCTDD